MSSYTRIGVGVLVFNSCGQILIGKRKGSHGSDLWAFPGGHLEFGEKIEDCARRETVEETGLIIKNIQHLGFSSEFYDENKDNKHYVTLFVQSDLDTGTLENKEPHKCEEWIWVEPDTLPEPLFPSILNLQKQGVSFSKKKAA